MSSVQISRSDLKRLAAPQGKVIGVSRKKAIEMVPGLTSWMLRKAVDQYPQIKIRTNRYNVSLLRQSLGI